MQHEYRAGRRVLAAALTVLVITTAPAMAAIDLTLTGADGELADNIRAHIDTEVVVDSELAGRFYRDQVIEEVRHAAEALGYYQAEADVTLRPVDDDWALSIAVTPGPRVRLRDVTLDVTGPGADDPGLTRIRRILPLQDGAALNHADYEDSKRAMSNEALQRGFFDYRFTTARLAVNAEGSWADATLVMDSGERYEFGEVTFSPTPFRREFLERLVPFRPGTPYTAAAVADFNQRLFESEYFEDAVVETQRDAATGKRIPVRAEVAVGERNTVTTGLGYSTDEGPRLRLGYERHYVNNRGHRFNSEVRLSSARQGLNARYEIPLADPVNDQLSVTTAWQNEDVEDSESERYSVRVGRRQTFTSGWTRIQSLRVLSERYRAGLDSGRSRLVLPGIRFSRTRSRGGVDPDWGDKQRYSLEIAREALLSDVDIARVRAGSTWLRNLREVHRFELSAELGGVASSDFTEVPTSLRFFAGGDQSVRGFAYQSLGPEDASGELTGGRYLTTASAEYSYAFTGDWRVATFVDTGDAYDSLDAFDPEVGTGFGVRWSSPVGPLRLDFAWGVSREEVPFRVHFSIGPPF